MPTILLKKSDTPGSVPGTANLTNLAGGVEVAVNTADKRVYSMTSASAVIELGTNPSSLTCADVSATVFRSASATITNLIATSASITTLTNNPTFGAGTANGVLYLNGSKVATSGSALTFDGTNLGLGAASRPSRLTLEGTNGAVGSQIQLVGTGVLSGYIGPSADGLNFGTDSGGLIFRTGVTGNGSVTTGSEGMRLTSTTFYTASGINVGIGTTTPEALLTVSKQSSGGEGGYIYIDNAAASALNNKAGIKFGTSSGASFSTFPTGEITNFVTNAGNGASDLAFGTFNGTSSGTRMTLDASGNLGIGTTSPGYKLTTSGSAQLYTSAAAIAFYDTAGQTTSRNWIIGNIAANAYGDLTFANSTTAGGAPTTQRMTLDYQGNLGIGTASPVSKLDVRSGYITGGAASATNGSKLLANYYTAGAIATWGAEYSSGGPIMGYAVWPSTSAASSFVSSTAIASARGAYTIEGSEHKWFSGASQTVAVDNAVTTTQAMTLDASGNLLVGTTTPAGYRFRVYDGISQFTQATSATDCADFWNRATSGDNKFVTFYTETSATSRGSITYNRTAGLVAYNTTSDVRLKDNIANAADSGDKVDAIKVRQFDWKETGNHVDYGFVAQELHAVAPHAVSKPEDEEAMWSVDYSKLVPMLVKELQSLRKRVAELEAK